MPKISVVVPVYNVEKYLKACLDSLIGQTLRDIEIICVDDGSTDASGKILDEYAANDDRIKVIHQKNGGLSCARNSGLNVAIGDYVSFVDSDDWVDTGFLEKLYFAVQKHNADITSASIIRKREHFEKYRIHYTSEVCVEALAEKIAMCNVPKCCYVVSKLYRRSLIANSKFTAGVYFEDVLWLPDVLKKSGKLVTVSDVNYYYRVNPDSTVKQRQSAKKIADRVESKRFIIRFFEENNLPLSRRDKTITKKIVYLGKIPLLKVKEFENKETSYLLGLLPIFKRNISNRLKISNKRKFLFVRFLDGHVNIELFGKIRIAAKTGRKPECIYQKTLETGVSGSKRIPQITVSLTSYPGRISTVDSTINTLLQQTVKPDRIVLYLADSQFPAKEDDLSEKLLKLCQYGLEIRWCEDLRSYKKLIPALRDFPDDIIVTADDDIYYQPDWLESLLTAYQQNPGCVCTRRAVLLKANRNNVGIYAHYANRFYQPAFGNQLMGGAGTLYPPHSLCKDIFDIEQVRNLIPTYDDIYFWAMAVVNDTKIALVKGFDVNICQREETRDSGLCKVNNGGSGMSPHEAFRLIFEKYPEIIEKLKE